MLVHGLNSPGKYYKELALLLTSCALILWGYKFLEKMTLRARANIIYSYFSAYGFDDFLCKCFVAQSAHETAGWTSDLFNNANNCFGMKYVANSRVSGNMNGYAMYNTIENSCNDMRTWYNVNRNKLMSLPLVISSISDYVTFLNNYNYFEDNYDNYLKGCTDFYNEIYL